MSFTVDLLIVTGLSGAGKTQAIHALEDIDYFCIDNIPSEMLGQFMQLCEKSAPKSKIAVGVDIRCVSHFGGFDTAKQQLKDMGYNVKTLYLDAADDVLLRRFKENRRKHPLLDEQVTVLQSAIALEREMLSPAMENAEYIIDTSALSTAQFRERIVALFSSDKPSVMSVSVMSFGFKHGIPADADLVFDVRCLPNPHYIKELRPLTGCDERVSGYVFSFDEAVKLLQHIDSLIDYSLPLYEREGKSSLVIAFGCTGGKHRSVSFAERVGKRLKENNAGVTIFHRDYTH